MQLARPLQPAERTAFLVALRLNGKDDLGDGAIYRLCRELQRQLFDAPDLSTGSGVGKYSRL